MKYAIIQIGGKQIKITEGLSFEIERQKKLDFDVVLYSDGKDILIGNPYVKGVKVKAKIDREERGNKVRVARFKSKSRYHKVRGHRQPLSIVKVESINKVGEEKALKKPVKTAKTIRKSAKSKKVSTRKG